jgi:polyisoprenoid-binding protein YceI
MNMLNKILLIVLLCIGNNIYARPPASAPSSYKVTIAGTSNLHSWDERVETVTASAGITKNADGSINIASFSVTMSVYSIKSTEGATMDNNTYKALKASQYPEIKYVLAAPANSINIESGVYTLSAKGNITIAGVTKEVQINVKIHEEGGKMVCEGTQKIMMTDYGVTPPVAMLGMLKTGNEITISYKLVF